MSKVTIVFPIYNVAACIEKSLMSALNQTYKDIEYLLVDDCGSDNSLDIAKTITKKHPDKDIKVIRHSQNMGLSAARNTGIKHANGEYIYFMDSDDTISSECIEHLVTLAIKTESDWVEGCTNVLGGKDSVLKPHPTKVYDSGDYIYHLFNGDFNFSAWNKVISLKWLKENNIMFIEGLIYEDLLFVLSLCKSAKKIAVSSEYTYNYIIRKNSITSNISETNINKQYSSILYNIDQLYAFLGSLSNNMTKELMDRWITLYKFKAVSRLIAINIKNRSFKRKYYNLIVASKSNNNGKGVLNSFMKLPYALFKILFYVPYLLYKKSF